MPVLYVENVPADLYAALKQRARSEGRSISAEVMRLLTEHVPTSAELARRRRVFDVARKIRKNQTGGRKQFESTEEMLRADRGR